MKERSKEERGQNAKNEGAGGFFVLAGASGESAKGGEYDWR